MTGEYREQSSGRYRAVNEAVTAYGASESFEDEPNFATTSTSLSLLSKNLTAVNPPDLFIQAVEGHPRVFILPPGSGKTCLIIEHARALLKPFEFAPVTLVGSGALETLFPIGHGSSMATQPPTITEDERVEEIIWRVRTTLPVRYRAKLASHLRELAKAVREEELEGNEISAKSLRQFIEFLQANPRLRCPTISVTPDLNIYASWKSGPDQVFSIHFLPDGNVRCVIFRPNEKHPGKVVRFSVTATADVIISVAERNGVLEWASE